MAEPDRERRFFVLRNARLVRGEITEFFVYNIVIFGDTYMFLECFIPQNLVKRHGKIRLFGVQLCVPRNDTVRSSACNVQLLNIHLEDLHSAGMHVVASMYMFW